MSPYARFAELFGNIAGDPDAAKRLLFSKRSLDALTEEPPQDGLHQPPAGVLFFNHVWTKLLAVKRAPEIISVLGDFFSK